MRPLTHVNDRRGPVELLDPEFDTPDYMAGAARVCSCGAVADEDEAGAECGALGGWFCSCCGEFHEAD